MRDASPTRGIPAPHCPVAHGQESYPRKHPLPHGTVKLPRQKKKIQERIRALLKLRDFHRCVTKCTSSPKDLPSQQPAPHENTDSKKATLIPILSPPLSNRTMRSSWLLFTLMANTLIAKPSLHSGGFKITWLGWASPTTRETIPANV